MAAGCSMERVIHEEVLYKQIKEVGYSDADLLKLISDREKKGIINDFVYRAYIRLAKERGLKLMLSLIKEINSAVNNFIWGVPAMICIIGVGLVLSIRTGFLQIREFPYAMKATIGRMFKKKEAADGAMTPFQAVCTALAATVGTGNIAGVAGAIAIGGPGAVFWMWISAILGMCTKFSEVTLAVHFREKNEKGELVGGPMYYIKNGLKK